VGRIVGSALGIELGVALGIESGIKPDLAQGANVGDLGLGLGLDHGLGGIAREGQDLVEDAAEGGMGMGMGLGTGLGLDSVLVIVLVSVPVLVLVSILGIESINAEVSVGVRGLDNGLDGVTRRGHNLSTDLMEDGNGLGLNAVLFAVGWVFPLPGGFHRRTGVRGAVRRKKGMEPCTPGMALRWLSEGSQRDEGLDFGVQGAAMGGVVGNANQGGLAVDRGQAQGVTVGDEEGVLGAIAVKDNAGGGGGLRGLGRGSAVEMAVHGGP
jgi:hypothetical protein